jgi:hypothetical protein
MEEEDPPLRPGIAEERLRNGPPALLEEKMGELEEKRRWLLAGSRHRAGDNLIEVLARRSGARRKLLDNRNVCAVAPMLTVVSRGGKWEDRKDSQDLTISTQMTASCSESDESQNSRSRDTSGYQLRILSSVRDIVTQYNNSLGERHHEIYLFEKNDM